MKPKTIRLRRSIKRICLYALVIIGLSGWLGTLNFIFAASECSWTGEWDTTYGMMDMVQTGSSVSGSYDRRTDEPITGTITGTVSGNTLSGTWAENTGDHGPFTFTMQIGCNWWKGYWQHHDGWFEWPWSGTNADYTPDGIRIELSGYDPETDSNEFEQGEAITITGIVNHNGIPTIPNKSGVDLLLEVPGTAATATITTKTDDKAQFSIMVFAGWNIGEYKLTASCLVYDIYDETYVDIKTERVFDVKKAEPGDINSSAVDQVISLYKQQIPTGPIRRFGKYGIKKPLLPESLYGCVHNMFYEKTWVDPESRFVCGGYQAQVFNFFSTIRFHSDPEKRKLLKGLDYGPIARGNPGNWYVLGIGAHHSVVLYPIGEAWKPYYETIVIDGMEFPLYVDRGVKVFDPWPKQKPLIYTVQDFEGPYEGTAMADPFEEEAFDPEKLFSGSPLVGAAVCTSMKHLKKYKAPPIYPTHAPEPISDDAYYLQNSINGFVIKCPVDVLISNKAGQSIGVDAHGTFVNETSGWGYQVNLEDEEKGWYFELPPDEEYSGRITAKSDGTFTLYMNGTQPGEILAYENEPISKDGQADFLVHSAARDLTLTLPDGSVKMPMVITLEAPDTSLWPRLFDFEDDNDQDWTNDGADVWSAANGIYTMAGRQEDRIRVSHHDDTFTNVGFQADVQKNDGDSETNAYGYGLRVRCDGTQKDYYEFNIIHDGRFMVGKSVGWNFARLVDWTLSDALTPGYNQWNTLKVTAQENFLEFYANGTLLASLEDTTFSAGKVGLFAVDAASSDPVDHLAFDNIVIEPLPTNPERQVYIPHITIDADDWIDYLQVDSNSYYSASFKITLYGSGIEVYSGVHTVQAGDKGLINLKVLSTAAECGIITYFDPKLNFRVSQENTTGGGVAEFTLTDDLNAALGFYFSDFNPAIVHKGMALANFGDTPALVTLSAIGGGLNNGTMVVTINPNSNLVGSYLLWFPELDLSQVKRITATAASEAQESLSGIALSGDMNISKALFTPAAAHGTGSDSVVYIPHITSGAMDWIDLLQVDNNSIVSTSFTITLYNNGEQVYSASHSVDGLGETVIDLKALNSAAETGIVSYVEPMLNFRLSQENLIGGGVAEFKLTGDLNSSLGFYFSDFTPSILSKGMAFTNFSTASAVVQLAAVGDGTVHETTNVTVSPRSKIIGDHTVWFPELNFSDVDRITASTATASLSGIAISGDANAGKLLFTPGTAIAP